MVLFHGDYSMGSLVALGMDAVAPDWATLGWEPVGFDLAHLAPSTREDPLLPVWQQRGQDMRPTW